MFGKLPTLAPPSSLHFQGNKKLRMALTDLNTEPLKGIKAHVQNGFHQQGITQYGMPGLNPTFIKDKASTIPPEFDVIQFESTLTPAEFREKALRIPGLSQQGKKLVFTWQGKTYGVEYTVNDGRLTC